MLAFAGHGCLLELAWAKVYLRRVAFGSVEWMNTFSNFTLCTRLAQRRAHRENFIIPYPVSACTCKKSSVVAKELNYALP